VQQIQSHNYHVHSQDYINPVHQVISFVSFLSVLSHFAHKNSQLVVFKPVAVKLKAKIEFPLQSEIKNSQKD
jgi:hypothetical protein